MNDSWRLITPARRYSPPPAPDDPVASALRELAARDRAAGRRPGDWSSEERERWLDGYRAQRTLMAFYEPVRWPDRVLAPSPAIGSSGPNSPPRRVAVVDRPGRETLACGTRSRRRP